MTIGFALAVGVTALFAIKAVSVERTSARSDATQAQVTRRSEFEARLQRALEMSKTETPVF